MLHGAIVSIRDDDCDGKGNVDGTVLYNYSTSGDLRMTMTVLALIITQTPPRRSGLIVSAILSWSLGHMVLARQL